MTDHPRGPIAAHRAAPFFARLVACGLIGRAEALAALLHASAPALVSPSGRQVRLTLQHDDATAEVRATRRRAASRARAALRPLLAAGAPRRTLLAAAHRAASPALRVVEIEHLIIEAISCHLRARRGLACPQPPNSR